VLQDSVRCIYRDLIICSVTTGKTQIVVQKFNLANTEQNTDSKQKKQSLTPWNPRYMFHELLHLPSRRRKRRRRRERNIGRGGGVAVSCSRNARVSYLNIWTYELFPDVCPYDAGHLITVHLDHGILGHNTLCCI
jgi:hypothetical protein